MAELTFKDRLQPALLDRLSDDEPDKKQEPREARLITRNRLRQAVMRDLAWLFNATRLGNTADFAGSPYVERSVVNFGLPALSGETASTLDVLALERTMRQAIIDFEPRIIATTVEVHAVVSEVELDHHNVISMEIRGSLWGQPTSVELLLRTEVDLETGEVEISDLAG